jgi:hypothetical protein
VSIPKEQSREHIRIHKDLVDTSRSIGQLEQFFLLLDDLRLPRTLNDFSIGLSFSPHGFKAEPTLHRI